MLSPETMHPFNVFFPLAFAALASSLAIDPAPAPAAPLEARKGKVWNIMTGSEECGADTANACVLRGGGDPTAAKDENLRFSNGNVCQGQTASFQSRFAHPEARGGAGAANPHCVVAGRIDDGCRINGRSGAQEVGLGRSTVKTTPVGTAETVGDVEFGGSCGRGAYIGSEIRIV